MLSSLVDPYYFYRRIHQMLSDKFTNLKFPEYKSPVQGLLLAPILGGLFVVFLPFIGLYLPLEMLVCALAKKIKGLHVYGPMPVGTTHLTGYEPKDVPGTWNPKLEKVADDLAKARK